MPGHDLFGLEGVQVPGAVVLLGGFETDGTNNPAVLYPPSGGRFFVSRLSTGLFGVFPLARDTSAPALDAFGGTFRGLYSVKAHLEPREANSLKRAYVDDTSQVPVSGGIIVRTQSQPGVDADLDGPIVWILASFRNTVVSE